MTHLEVIGIGFGITVLIVGVSGALVAWLKDRKQWNKGVCGSCYGGVWKSTACDSGGNGLFECTNCGTSWWESGYGSKVELNPDTSQDIIRAMKLKKLRKNLD